MCGRFQGPLPRQEQELRIVAWRKAIRFECRRCGVRFSMSVDDIDKGDWAHEMGPLVDIILGRDEA
jgi:hypothetical protein